MNLLSGDQNGVAAPSVPGNICAESALSGRTQRVALPDSSFAVKANLLPSGEIAPLAGATSPVPPAASNVILSGGLRSNFTICVSEAGLRLDVTIAVSAIAVIERIAATGTATQIFDRRDRTGFSSSLPLSEIRCSS